MKKFLLTLLASLSLLTAAGTLFALPTFAEGEDAAKTTWLQISPTAVSLTLEAGQDINPGDDACPNEIDAGCAVEVTNSGTQPFTFRVYASPYVVTGEDYSLSFSEDASTSYTQIYRWISFQDLDGSYVSAIQRQINPGETVTRSPRWFPIRRDLGPNRSRRRSHDHWCPNRLPSRYGDQGTLHRRHP